jgi:NAD(P)-dependent dehydrogenase (short-subunit alcohol dehydrogenase family)
MRKPDDIARAFERIGAMAGSVDALVCSAGVTRVGELAQTSVEDADLMLDVNLKGPWLAIREALPWLRKNAHVDDPSRVVVVGSIAGMRPKISSGLYGASKAAVHVLAQIYAVELGPSGITVNVVAPGSTNTGMNALAISEGANDGFNASGPSRLAALANQMTSPARSCSCSATKRAISTMPSSRSTAAPGRRTTIADASQRPAALSRRSRGGRSAVSGLPPVVMVSALPSPEVLSGCPTGEYGGRRAFFGTVGGDGQARFAGKAFPR